MRIYHIIIALLALLVLPWQANAGEHRGVYEDLGKETGIYIAPLVHGQMVVLDNHQQSVRAAAGRYATDPVMAKLIEWEGKEFISAGEGKYPMAVANADHRLHLPTHAYLAALRAMTMRMREMAPGNSPEYQLASQIDFEIVKMGAHGLATCANSDTAFNTNVLVGPDMTLPPPTDGPANLSANMLSRTSGSMWGAGFALLAALAMLVASRKRYA